MLCETSANAQGACNTVRVCACSVTVMTPHVLHCFVVQVSELQSLIGWLTNSSHTLKPEDAAQFGNHAGVLDPKVCPSKTLPPICNKSCAASGARYHCSRSSTRLAPSVRDDASLVKSHLLTSTVSRMCNSVWCQAVQLICIHGVVNVLCRCLGCLSG